jgi:hypothetical protein
VNAFIDEHRARCGVEPICTALQVAPSAYRRHAARERSPALRPARAKRDGLLLPEVQRVFNQNLQVYGADKVWRQLHREGLDVARCTVERLMRRAGLRGARRGKSVRTTVPDAKAACPLDRVNRQFTADRPNQLWVADFSAPCRRGLQLLEKGGTTRSANRSWLILDRQLKCCLAPVEAGRKGAAKLGRLPTAGCHAQSSLNCTEHGRSAAARRATARSMVRQRSVRWKPLYSATPRPRDGHRGAIRLGLMFPSGGCALPHSTMDFLPQPSSGATRGRARHLRT